MELFNVDDPAGNHNGGNIAFGPDGFLYIGIGDGGGGNDQHGTIGNGQLSDDPAGQDAAHRRGDTRPPRRSRTPFRRRNPFAANRALQRRTARARRIVPEIYAYGFRNPWRWSFDRVSGELWLNDVGQGALEEVDRVTLGGNYGWRCFEGTNRYRHGLRAEQADLDCSRRAIRPHAGPVDHRRFRVPRQRHSRAGTAATCSRDFATGNIWHIARDTHADADADHQQHAGYRPADFLVRRRHRR